MPENDTEKDLVELGSNLLSDLFFFTRFFYELLTKREFLVSNPLHREPHVITICRELTDVFLLKTPRLMINVPPGFSKTTLCQLFVSYCFAWYADCRFLYLSHSFDLASTHTHTIKKIMSLRQYIALFNVHLRRDQSAKDFFETTDGGAVAAFGSKGSIVGRDAGLPGLPRFSGCLLLDDMHKPDEVHSDTIREKVHKNYFETIETRLRSANVPVVFIGQRLHEDDLCAHLLNGADGMTWRHVNLKALDDNSNALYPEVMPKQKLLVMKEKQPYVFSAQYQQEPVPAGGALFKEEWFQTLDKEPEILTTFLTFDGAETEKHYNDATAMSFWGLYKLKHDNVELNMYALHWIDCIEEWVEPAQLEELFMDFYVSCLRYPVQPNTAAIEKKSTGTYLLSLLKKRQVLTLIDVERSIADGSKTDRFIKMQPYLASRQVTLPKYGKHNTNVIKHMKSITASNVHKRDDIADTCQIAIDIALIRKLIIQQSGSARQEVDKKVKNVMRGFTKYQKLKNRRN